MTVCYHSKTMRYLIPILLSACAVGDVEPPLVHLDLSGVHEEDRPTVMDGAREWEACGVAFVEEDEADIIGRVYSATPADGIGYGSIQGETILLWSGWGEYTRVAAAHEVGHLILDDTSHIGEGEGVMGTPLEPMLLTDADKAFACEVGGLCCNGGF